MREPAAAHFPDLRDRTLFGFLLFSLGFNAVVWVDGIHTGNPGPIHGATGGTLWWLGVAGLAIGPYMAESAALEWMIEGRRTSPEWAGVLAASLAVSHAFLAELVLWTSRSLFAHALAGIIMAPGFSWLAHAVIMSFGLAPDAPEDEPKDCDGRDDGDDGGECQ